MVDPLPSPWIPLVIQAILMELTLTRLVYQKGPEIRTGVMRDEIDVCLNLLFRRSGADPHGR